MVGTPLPAVPGVRDIAGLVRWLDAYDDGRKWLKDAAKVVKENEEAVRLLGSRTMIEAEMNTAERAKDKAEAVLESAKAQAESIVEAAKAGVEEQTESLKSAREELAAQRSRFNDKMSKADGGLLQRTQDVTEREGVIGAAEDAVSKREAAISAHEKRVEKREADARRVKEEAEKTVAGMKAALNG